MAEGIIQVAPDSTGSKLRTRSRTVGANTVHEQYVISQSERVVAARAWVSSHRIPVRASASQPVFTLWNGGLNLVSVRRLSMEVDSIVASTALAPYVRLYRITAAPTGGTVLAKGLQDTAETSSAAIVATCDASADGTNSATALAATANPTTHLWQQTVPRWHTLVGYGSLPVLNLLPDDANLNQEDPIILRPTQGLLVRVEAAAAMTAAAYSLYLKCAFGEFTLP